MSCERWVKTISLRLDGECSELDGAALDRHLTVCPACRVVAAETSAMTQLIRGAPFVELGRAIVVGSPRRARQRLMRRTAVVLAIAVGLATTAGLTLFSESPPKYPSSALEFRNMSEQRQFVRAELIRLEPRAVLESATAPRFAGRGLL
jgi:anti-sigma factor RsiW